MAKNSQETYHRRDSTKLIGRKVLFYDEVSSTNDVAAQLALRGEPEGTVIVADAQSAGRGRKGRRWESAKGLGLWFSIILRPEVVPAESSRLTILAAVGSWQALCSLTNIQVKIKWPNDLVVNNKKLAGILTETTVAQGNTQFVVVGIGLNLNHTLDDFPDALRLAATSLFLQTGRVWSRSEVLGAVLEEFDAVYALFRDGQMPEVLRRCKEASCFLGRRIRVIENGLVTEGVAEDLTETGSLLLRKDDGSSVQIISGDVELL